MSDTHYLTGKEPLIRQIAAAAFPSYTGNKFKIRVSEHPINVRSYWDGGSRDYYSFVALATMRGSGEVPAQSAYDARIPGAEAVVLPAGVVCVQHAIFCGKDTGLTIIVHPRDLNPSMLPERAALSGDDALVLAYIAHRKASYDGKNRYQMARADGHAITAVAWDEAKARLHGCGLINKAGAITPAGRNADAQSGVQAGSVRYRTTIV
jgi:hypothetical protein